MPCNAIIIGSALTMEATMADPRHPKSMARNALSVAMALLLCAMLVPTVALANPGIAEAAQSPTVSVTRAATGKLAIKSGASYKLSAKATKGAKLSYKSSKPSVVSVNKKGVLKAKRTGSATVTVTAKMGKRKVNKKIKVAVVKSSKYKKVKRISVKPTTKILTAGKTARIKTSFTPSKASNKNLVYKSSNTKVLTVNASGTMTAKKAGKAKVTVTSCDNPKAKKTLSITVKPAPSKTNGSGSPAPQKPTTPVPESDPATTDSDGDGFPDYVEKNFMGTDPNKPNSDESLENKVVYDEGAKKVAPDEVIDVSSDPGTGKVSITVKAADLPQYSSGDVVVADSTATVPGGAAVKVESTKRNQDGTVTLVGKAPALEEAFSYFNSSGKMEVDWDGMVLADGVSADIPDAQSRAKGSVGVDKEVTFTLGDWKADTSYEDAKNGCFENSSANLNGKVTLRISDVTADVQASPVLKSATVMGVKIPYKVGVAITRCNLSVDGSATASVHMGASANMDVTIAEIPIWGVLGEGIYMKVTLHSEADGTILVETGVDYDFGMKYNAKKSQNPSIYGKLTSPHAKAELNASCKEAMVPKCALELFGIEVLTLAAETGLQGKATSMTRSNPDMLCCDARAWAYLDVSAEALQGLDWADLKKEVEIVKESNSPLKAGWHWEDGKLVGGAGDCTWGPMPEGDFVIATDNSSIYDEDGQLRQMFVIPAGKCIRFKATPSTSPTGSKGWAVTGFKYNCKQSDGSYAKIRYYETDYSGVITSDTGVTDTVSFGAPSPSFADAQDAWNYHDRTLEVRRGYVVIERIDTYYSNPNPIIEIGSL